MPDDGLRRKVSEFAARLLRRRWLVRAPIWLYRARLGALFGARLLMLEHTGRRSGNRRQVVLEVVARPTPRSYVVASGFGTRAHWFRNIRANPSVWLWSGSRAPRPGTATVLNPQQASAALAEYATAHPRAWRTLRPVFEVTLNARIDIDHQTLPLVRIDLDAAATSSNARSRRVTTARTRLLRLAVVTAAAAALVSPGQRNSAASLSAGVS